MSKRLIRMAASASMILFSALAFASVAEADSSDAPQVTNRVDEQKARELRYEAWEAKRDASKSSSVLGSEYERMRDSKRKCVYKGREVKCPQSSDRNKDIPDPFKDPSAAQAEKSEALLRAEKRYEESARSIDPPENQDLAGDEYKSELEALLNSLK